MSKVEEFEQRLFAEADPVRAEFAPRFFKTGIGEYGEGDKFIGVSNPRVWTVAKDFWQGLSLEDVKELLQDPIHEVRLGAVMVLVEKYAKADQSGKEEVFKFYLDNTEGINNWDIVDASCYKIVGKHLAGKSEQEGLEVLLSLSKSQNMWERCIAMVSTLGLLMAGKSQPTYVLAKELLDDKHDLMHKAVGWMLREAVKRVSEEELVEFIREHKNDMPRTALRYAIERLDSKLKAELMRK